MRFRLSSSTSAGAGVAALALVLAGCSSSSGKAAVNDAPATTSSSAAPATTAPATPASAAAVKVIPGSATGKSPCEQAAPTPASPGEIGTGSGGSTATETAAAVAAEEHGGRGAVQQLPLTPAQQSELDAQMAAAKAVVARYPTVKDAEAAGYGMSTVYVPCIGAHYTNLGLTGQFNPGEPSELLYDGTSPDSKIVGLSYLVYHPGGPPPGFAGPNDRWHQHNANGGLCFKGSVVIGGEDTTRQQCAARGGRKSLLTDIWMVHAWVAPGILCSWGVFSGECPSLGGQLGGNAFEGPYPSKIS